MFFSYPLYLFSVCWRYTNRVFNCIWALVDCNNSHGTDTMLCAVLFLNYFLILMAALNKKI